MIKIVLFLFVMAVPLHAQRPYWPVPLDTLAAGHLKHTHVEVTGVVAAVVSESDGDKHIRLVAPSRRFIIVECIPLIPCVTVKVGQTLRVHGISRWDPEHHWAEVHPAESILVIK